VLAGHIGIESPQSARTNTLQSSCAVVLRGASITGGRRFFLVTFASVILVQEITFAARFLGLGADAHVGNENIFRRLAWARGPPGN
jgi:ribose/xylose/arabinose/galactoside ABC-type transport system permease subunit